MNLSALMTQFTIFCAVQLLRLVTNDDIIEKVTNIEQHSRSQTTMESFWSVLKLST